MHARTYIHTYYVRMYLVDRQSRETDRQTLRQVDETRHKRVERGHRAVTLLRHWILDNDKYQRCASSANSSESSNIIAEYKRQHFK